MNAPSLACLGTIAALGLGLAATPAAAQSLDPIFLGGFNCPTANCRAMKIVGRVNGQDTRANPYVAMFGVGAGGCLRLDMTFQRTDLEMTVVAPDGTIYTSDDIRSGPCPNCPRVIVGNQKAGFYTVVISQWEGRAVEAGFNLYAGWYLNAANVNCANPTTPQDTRAAR